MGKQKYIYDMSKNAMDHWVRLHQPEDPIEESKKQLQDSPFTGAVNLANTITNVLDRADGKEGNIPFLGTKPFKITDTTAIQSNTKVKGKELYNPDKRLLKAIEEESNKPFQIFGQDTGMTKGEQVGYSNLNEYYKEKNKPLFQKAVENVYNSLDQSAGKINRAIFDKDSNLAERGADLTLGVIGSALNVVLTPMNFFTPAGQDIGEEIGKITTPEFGKAVGEFLPFLTMPNPIAFYGASVGSDIATKEVMKIVNNTTLSDKNKERILEGVGLGSFVLTHRALGKGFKSITPERVKTFLDKEISDVDKTVLDSMNPKKQGEKQIDVRQDVKAPDFKLKESETKPVEGLTQEKSVAELMPKPEVKISKIKEEPIENKTVENIKKAQDIVGKEKFTEIADKLTKVNLIY